MVARSLIASRFWKAGPTELLHYQDTNVTWLRPLLFTSARCSETVWNRESFKKKSLGLNTDLNYVLHSLKQTRMLAVTL